MEKFNSSHYLNHKLIENSNNQITQNGAKHTKKRIHSEMAYVNDKLFDNRCSVNIEDDVSTNSVTNKFANLAIKKQLKVNKYKTISKYYIEKKKNFHKENYFEGMVSFYKFIFI